MKMKKDNKLVYIGLIIVVVLGIFAIASIPKKEVYDYENMTQEEINLVIDEKMEDLEIMELSELGERDRMERYLSSFISSIENKEYEKAYEMLYDDFKNNYFPTLESFETYAKKTFPSLCALEYTNIERNGEVYVMWVIMSNALGSSDSDVEMNFVIRENELNDFDLSFSVI